MAAAPFAPGQHAFAGSRPPLPEGEVAWLWEVDTEEMKETASAVRAVPADLVADVQSLQQGLSRALGELGCLRDEVETLRGELAAVRAASVVASGLVGGTPTTEAVQEEEETKRRSNSSLSMELRDLVASECRAGTKVLAGAVQGRISELEALTKALCSVSPPLPSAPSLASLGKEDASAPRTRSQTAEICEGPIAASEGSSPMGLSPKARAPASRYDISDAIPSPSGTPTSSPSPRRPNSEMAFFRHGGSPRLSGGASRTVASGVHESCAVAATSLAQRPQSSLEAPALRARRGLPPSVRWPPPRWEQAPLSSRGWHW